MSTPQSCIARAEEAERLAVVVSYERDRTRLRRQAVEWRALAAELQAAAAEPAPPSRRGRWLNRLIGALRRRAG